MRFFLPLLLLLSPLLAQEAATSDDQEWLQKEVGLEQMFRTPPDKFLPLAFHRIDTLKLNGAERVRYSIRAAGLRPDKHYVFMAWELGSEAPKVMLPSVQVDAKGVLRCDSEATDCPGGAGAQVNVAVSNNPGQPSRFVVADEEEQPLAIGEIIPEPSTVTDHACSLETVLLRPDGTIALLTGHGFDPGEDIKVIHTSFDEHVANSGKASNKGDYQTVLLPFAKGHDAGETMVTMNSSGCELSTHFHWGAKKEEAETPPAAEPTVPPSQASPSTTDPSPAEQAAPSAPAAEPHSSEQVAPPPQPESLFACRRGYTAAVATA